MCPRTWTFFAFCLVHYAQCSKTDSTACDVASSESDEEIESLGRTLENLTMIFQLKPDQNLTRHPVPGVDTAQARSAVEDLCMLERRVARIVLLLSQFFYLQAVEHDSVSRGKRLRWLTMTPDVLRTLAKSFLNIYTDEYIQHAQTLWPCWNLLSGPMIEVSEALLEEKYTFSGWGTWNKKLLAKILPFLAGLHADRMCLPDNPTVHGTSAC